MSDPIPTARQREFTAEILSCVPVSSKYAHMVLPRENQEQPVSEFKSKSTAGGSTTEKTVSNGDKIMVILNYTSTPTVY